ncbi:MAG: 4Fe-4S binding protein [Deltaproteobacteria bacterium]|nr:4Fe-4S binding protein [Deltaproteobacteria bacterium]
MMNWLPQAEAEIRKAPFFVRKRARKRVEEHVAADGREVVTAADGREVVTAADVKSVKKRFLTRMDEEVKGFQVEACFGAQGCPNRVMEDDGLVQSIEAVLAAEDLRGFLKQTVNGPLKFHHEFRVTLADCPNACSQPQIKDMGIIGAVVPERTDAPCSECGACVDVCREEAVALEVSPAGPVFDWDRCVRCGQCIHVCPTGTIGCGRKGYRLLIGGKLGRHPRLATELPGLYDAQTIVHLVKWCVQYYKAHSRGGERFAELVQKAGPAFFDRLSAGAVTK